METDGYVGRSICGQCRDRPDNDIRMQECSSIQCICCSSHLDLPWRCGLSYRVRRSFAAYSEVPSARGYTGAEAAQHLLDRAGITDVRVVPTNGFLSDHYNPLTKELALSEAVYSSRSIAAIGVAAHEAGHAIQHAAHYFPCGCGRSWCLRPP